MKARVLKDIQVSYGPQNLVRGQEVDLPESVIAELASAGFVERILPITIVALPETPVVKPTETQVVKAPQRSNKK